MNDDSMDLGRPDRRTELAAALRRVFPLLQFIVDALAWALAIPLGTFLRYDLRLSAINAWGVLGTVLVVIMAQGLLGMALGLYRRRYHYGSLEEVRALAICMALVGAVAFVVQGIFGQGSLVPRSVPLLSSFLALVIAAVARYVARLVEDRHLRPTPEASEPLVVYGAGHTGTQITRTMLRTKESPLRPVALLDDDPQKARMRVHGLRVRGRGVDAVAVAEEHGAKSVLVAITTLSGEQLATFSAPLLDAGLRVLVLPPFAELLGDVRPSDVRPLSVADLLGRHPAEVDAASIADYVTGRRVLVTGAGGSIGSELCRQLRTFNPAELVMLDRDESGLHATQLKLEGRALLDSPTLVLADLRDRDRIFQVFMHFRPEVVFHAAALKHQPLLEFNPAEAWKTNVIGTHHVLEAAKAADVVRLVNVSTDKAADPACVLGFSKRISERLTAEVANRTGRPFVSVRFGNVLGSRGSVLGVFEQQIETGGPITITHEDVTRYFMTTEEAIALTIQAGALGEPGEVLVLDMGSPVRILELARRLAEHRGAPSVPITMTGLRAGEKLHERLIGEHEVDQRPNHRLISQVPVPELRLEDALTACTIDDRLILTATSLAMAADWGLGAESKRRAPSTMMVGDGGDD